jgi:PD-(D/E)XK endonuclease
MRDTKIKGDISEAMIVARLLQKGHSVLIPFGDRQRFDLVTYDDSGVFTRIQCKTGHLSNGAVVFRAASVHKVAGSHRYTEKTYEGEADLFMVYCPELGKIYSIPVKSASNSKVYLRIDRTKSNRQSGVRWAKDFEL